MPFSVRIALHRNDKPDKEDKILTYSSARSHRESLPPQHSPQVRAQHSPEDLRSSQKSPAQYEHRRRVGGSSQHMQPSNAFDQAYQSATSAEGRHEPLVRTNRLPQSNRSSYRPYANRSNLPLDYTRSGSQARHGFESRSMPPYPESRFTLCPSSNPRPPLPPKPQEYVAPQYAPLRGFVARAMNVRPDDSPPPYTEHARGERETSRLAR